MSIYLFFIVKMLKKSKIFFKNSWHYKQKIVLLYYASDTITECRKEHTVDYIFNNDRPIYMQLVEKIRVEIISGKFKPGEKLPSVRELALTAKVNPNTMQKALIDLEELGLIFTERTNGKFVTTDKKVIENMKKDLAKEISKNYLKDMQNIGINHKDSINYLLDMAEENK